VLFDRDEWFKTRKATASDEVGDTEGLNLRFLVVVICVAGEVASERKFDNKYTIK
jgi:hypothetical protein